MADSTLRKPTAISFEGNVAESWRVFEQQFRIYWKASLKKKDPDEVAYTLLNLVGQEAVERERTFVYKTEIKDGDNIVQAAENREDPETLIRKFREHCNPQKHVMVERHIFNSRTQKSGESAEAFISDLRKLASTCEYGALTNDLIRDRLLCGCNNEEVKTQMLKEGDLPLERALEILVIDELATQRKTQLGGKEEVHAVRPKNWNKQKSSCLNCGGSHPRIPQKCPAFGKQCHTCHTMNHFAKCCMRYSQQIQAQQQQQQTQAQQHDQLTATATTPPETTTTSTTTTPTELSKLPSWCKTKME